MKKAAEEIPQRLLVCKLIDQSNRVFARTIFWTSEVPS